MTLTEFLLARIAEDEYAFSWLSSSGSTVYIENVPMNAYRLLAECAAKRAIVASVESFRTAGDKPGEELDAALVAHGAATGLTVAMGYLALPYAEHPDYDEAWRP